MDDEKTPVSVFVIGFGIAALFGAAIAILPLMNFSFQQPPPAVIVEEPLPPTTVPLDPPTTATPGEQLLDGVGSAAGEVWAGATSPDAKQWYSDTWDGVKSGAGRVADSFNETVANERQNQQQSP